jgi:hypothetical protein
VVELEIILDDELCIGLVVGRDVELGDKLD